MSQVNAPNRVCEYESSAHACAAVFFEIEFQKKKQSVVRELVNTEEEVPAVNNT